MWNNYYDAFNVALEHGYDPNRANIFAKYAMWIKYKAGEKLVIEIFNDHCFVLGPLKGQPTASLCSAFGVPQLPSWFTGIGSESTWMLQEQTHQSIIPPNPILNPVIINTDSNAGQAVQHWPSEDQLEDGPEPEDGPFIHVNMATPKANRTYKLKKATLLEDYTNGESFHAATKTTLVQGLKILHENYNQLIGEYNALYGDYVGLKQTDNGKIDISEVTKSLNKYLKHLGTDVTIGKSKNKTELINDITNIIYRMRRDDRTDELAQ